MPFIGRLGACGLGKEITVGTPAVPTTFVPFHPPLSVAADIALLESKGIYSIPDVVYKAVQGPGGLKAGKINFEAEPENGLDMHLMSIFGTDTPTETASFVITGGVNDKIDFKENGGTTRTGTLTPGTYIAGTTSATDLTLCEEIKDAMDGAPSAGLTYTVTYSMTTKKFTITASSTTVQIMWLTGSNNATAAYAVLGFSKTDTSAGIAVTSDSTTQPAAWSHAFSRIAQAIPPTYTLWTKNGVNFPQFAGCLCSKLELTAKAKEMVMVSADWVGLNYSAGSTQSIVSSSHSPFKFNQVVLSVISGPTNYDNLKLTFDNSAEVSWVLGNTIYGTKIVSKGFKVTLAADLIFEDTVEWLLFINGTASGITTTITSSELLGGLSAIAFSLTIVIPTINYNAAPIHLPDGTIKIPFTATGVYTPGSTKTASATLVNTISTTY